MSDIRYDKYLHVRQYTARVCLLLAHLLPSLDLEPSIACVLSSLGSLLAMSEF